MLNKELSQVTVAIPKLTKGDGYVHLPQNAPSQQEDARLNSAGTAGGRPAIFLDRDGVLVEDVGFLRTPADLKILPGVTQALWSLDFRFRFVVITNQSGIARGLFSENDLLAIHQELAGRLVQDGVAVDAFYYCPHLPEGSVPNYSVNCKCRKPKPGMLRQASRDLGISLSESYMIGDNPRDVLAGLAAGAKGIMIGKLRNGCPDSAAVAGNLLEAAKLILSQGNVAANVSTGEPRDSVEPVPAVAAPWKSQ